MEKIILDNDRATIRSCRLVCRQWLCAIAKLYRKKKRPQFVVNTYKDTVSLEEPRPRPFFEPSTLLYEFIKPMARHDRIEGFIPTFSLTLGPSYFRKSNYNDFVNCLVQCGPSLVELYIRFPKNSAMSFLLPPSINLPNLNTFGVAFSAQPLLGHNFPIAYHHQHDYFPNNSSIHLVQTILNASSNLRRLQFMSCPNPMNPPDMENLYLPESLTTVHIETPFRDFELLLRRGLNHLTEVRINATISLYSEETIYDLFSKLSPTVRTVWLTGPTATRRSLPIRLPRMTALTKFVMFKPWEFEERNPPPGFEEMFPALETLVFANQTEYSFTYLMSGMRSTTVTSFCVWLTTLRPLPPAMNFPPVGLPVGDDHRHVVINMDANRHEFARLNIQMHDRRERMRHALQQMRVDMERYNRRLREEVGLGGPGPAVRNDPVRPPQPPADRREGPQIPFAPPRGWRYGRREGGGMLYHVVNVHPDMARPLPNRRDIEMAEERYRAHREIREERARRMYDIHQHQQQRRHQFAMAQERLIGAREGMRDYNGGRRGPIRNPQAPQPADINPFLQEVRPDHMQYYIERVPPPPALNQPHRVVIRRIPPHRPRRHHYRRDLLEPQGPVVPNEDRNGVAPAAAPAYRGGIQQEEQNPIRAVYRHMLQRMEIDREEVDNEIHRIDLPGEPASDSSDDSMDEDRQGMGGAIRAERENEPIGIVARVGRLAVLAAAALAPAPDRNEQPNAPQPAPEAQPPPAHNEALNNRQIERVDDIVRELFDRHQPRIPPAPAAQLPPPPPAPVVNPVPAVNPDANGEVPVLDEILPVINPPMPANANDIAQAVIRGDPRGQPDNRVVRDVRRLRMRIMDFMQQRQAPAGGVAGGGGPQVPLPERPVTMTKEKMQSINLAFPNLVKLTINISGPETCGLKYIFEEMRSLQSLRIIVESSLWTIKWDSLLTGIPADFCDAVRASSDIWDEVYLNETSGSIRNLASKCTNFSLRILLQNSLFQSGFFLLFKELEELMLLECIKVDEHRDCHRGLAEEHYISDVAFHFALLKMKELKHLTVTPGFEVNITQTFV